MYIEYFRSKVTGYNPEKDEKAEDEFFHLKNQDPILMACRRSNRMAGMPVIRVSTSRGPRRWVDDGAETKKAIPRSVSWEYEF